MTESSVRQPTSYIFPKDLLKNGKQKMTFQRVFTKDLDSPYDGLEWVLFDAEIKDFQTGDVVFRQEGVTFPSTFSQQAVNIVTEKYFYGQLGTDEREHDLRQLIDRVIDKIVDEGVKADYFNKKNGRIYGDELKFMLSRQMFAFNSPVWFNIGTNMKQQSSACQPANALIDTPEGFVEMIDLVERFESGKKVQVFDKDGVADVVAVKRNGVKSVYRVETDQGFFIDATGDHLVWCSTEDGADFIQVDDIEIDIHNLRWVRDAHSFSDDVSISPQEAWLAGYLRFSSRILIEDTPDHPVVDLSASVNIQQGSDSRRKLKASAQEVFSNTITRDFTNDVYQRLASRSIRFEPQDDSSEIMGFIKKWNLVDKASEVLFPKQALTMSKAATVEFIAGVFDGCGIHMDSEETTWVRMSSMSFEFINGIQLLLSRLGIFSCVSEWPYDGGNNYILSIHRSEDLKLFNDLVAPSCSKEVKIKQSHLEFDGKTSGLDLGVVDVEYIGDMEVFDIQTSSGEYKTQGLRIHNCFINKIEDSMESICELQTAETMIFKGGSGAGVNLSPLRSEKEPLTGGGFSSGPLSFMRGFDAFGGVIKSGGRCLAPYQKVYTINGPVDVKTLAEQGDDFYCLSYDPPAKRFMIKTARAWQSSHKEVMKVTTDKGSFYLSDDHPVRLSNGPMVKVKDLKKGMSLFQCAIQNFEGYRRVNLRNGQKGKDLLHRMVARDVCGYEIDGLHVHHVDGDINNNSPANLEVLTASAHATHHMNELVEAGEHVFQNNTFPKAGSLNPMHSSSDFWKDEDRVRAYKEKQSNHMKNNRDAKQLQNAAATQRMINTAFKLINAGYDIDSFDEYYAARVDHMGRVASRSGLLDMINQRFGDYGSFYQEVRANNHKVISVESVGWMDVYDVEVDCSTADDKTENSGHNFVIWDGDESFGQGIVVSNTRRAAKMIILDSDHPDIMKFIESKVKEEEKAQALIEKGYDGGFNVPGGAYDSVFFQNANHSVRADDEFMESVLKNEMYPLRARTTGDVIEEVSAYGVMEQIALCTWRSGDPGMQFDGEIQKMHTCANDDKIRASNPCCFVAETLIETEDGPMTIGQIYEMQEDGVELPNALSWDLDRNVDVHSPINRVWIAGHTDEPVEVCTASGIRVTCTPEHRFLTVDGDWVEAVDLHCGQLLQDGLAGDGVVAVNHLKLDEEVRVFDMEVQDYHNFFVTSDESTHGDAIVAHNSEYLFVDNTACNLASVNLMCMIDSDGNQNFGIDHFNFRKYDYCNMMIFIAQDILCEFSEYPTPAIAETTTKYRTIGLGFVNLGGMLMACGVPYDSPKGRIFASIISSRMTARAYETSTVIAEMKEPFERYFQNIAPCTQVLETHWQRARKDAMTPHGLTELAKDNEDIWANVLARCMKHGIRNAQATVLAPGGTISFFMDAQTTGIEPEIAHIKFKTLVGGGTIKMVNDLVLRGLTALGYSKEDTDEIVKYVYENGYIQGAPKLKPEHLTVFDTSFNAVGDDRALSWRAHVDMMAAIQPYISGAISKTVNMPETSTVEEILEAYVYSWKMGLKAVAIYRNNSKGSQPLNTSIDDDVEELHPVADLNSPPLATRHRLKETRESLTHKFNVGGHEGYLTVGLYPNGEPGEIFLVANKEGSTMRGLLDAFSTSISLNLQYGVPLYVLCEKFKHMRFEPSGITMNQDVRTASSIIDYVFSWLELTFLTATLLEDWQGEEHPGSELQGVFFEQNNPFGYMARPKSESSGPPCDRCGSFTVPSGKCHTCPNCGSTTGCG